MFVDLKKKMHQDNLKAEIFHRFKIRFLETEFSLLCEYTENNCRFDLLVFNTITTEVTCIIEVRRIDAMIRVPIIETKKYAKYSVFGKPLLFITRFNEIDKLIDDISKLINK